MNWPWSQALVRGVQTYWLAISELRAHLQPRLKFIGIARERLKRKRPLPLPIRNILVVCRGNICRSPMGHVYLAERSRALGMDLSVKSAGIETTPGKPAHALAQEVSRENGYLLDQHGTTPLYGGLIEKADVVFVMEVDQKDRLARLYPHMQAKVFLLGQFCQRGPLEIDDPYSGTKADFQHCFERIKSACDQVLLEMRGDRGQRKSEPSVS